MGKQDRETMKKQASYAAVEATVRSGMKLGMGTGSTVAYAIECLGERLQSGALSDILVAPTSFDTQMACEQRGIPLCALNDRGIDGRLDLTIDGADEVSPELYLSKGGGGALTQEKITAYASAAMVVVVDEQKLVQHLAETRPVVLEVLAIARRPVERALAGIGAVPTVRMAVHKAGPVITDNGNILLDIRYTKASAGFDAVVMEAALNAIPGVVENGIFTHIRPTVYVARSTGSVDVLTHTSPTRT